MQMKQRDPHSSLLGATAPLRMILTKQEEAHSARQSWVPGESSQADVTHRMGINHLYDTKPREVVQLQTEGGGKVILVCSL